MKSKLTYEEVSVEVVLLPESDVIKTSTPFDGREDTISEWFEW